MEVTEALETLPPKHPYFLYFREKNEEDAGKVQCNNEGNEVGEDQESDREEDDKVQCNNEEDEKDGNEESDKEEDEKVQCNNEEKDEEDEDEKVQCNNKDDEESRCSLILYNMVECKIYSRCANELSGKKLCWPSPLGWLLIHYFHPPSSYLLNLLTMEKVQLPTLFLDEEAKDTDYKFVISSSPNEYDLCIVLFADFKNRLLNFCRLAEDESKWVHRDYKHLDITENIIDIAVLNGQFYGLTDNYNIAIINYSYGTRLSKVEIELRRGSFDQKRRILESCGELFLIPDGC